MKINRIQMSLEECRFLITEAAKNGQKKGREEAWDFARRIFGDGSDCYSYDEVYDAFDIRSFWQILGMLVEEVLSKDKKHQEEKKALRVGDEVKFRSTDMLWLCGYVIKIRSYESVTVLTKDGTAHVLRISDLAKTGNFNEDLVKALAAFDDMDSEK